MRAILSGATCHFGGYGDNFVPDVRSAAASWSARALLMLLPLLPALPAGAAYAADPGAEPAVVSGAAPVTVPAELRVGAVSIRGEDIYTEAELAASSRALRMVRRGMNAINFRTKNGVIRRELLFRSGDALDPAALAETERNLRALGFLTNVQVVPVDTLADGSVPVEVRAQETWSLTMRFSYSRADNDEQRWNLSVADNNVLGTGIRFEAGGGRDEDRSYGLVRYFDRRLLGSRWTIGMTDIEQSDGSVRELDLMRPFYRQDDPRGLEIRLWRREADWRHYLSQAGPAGIDPAGERLYCQVPAVRKGLLLKSMWRVSRPRSGAIVRLGAGLKIEDRDYDTPEVLALSDGRRIDGGFLLDDPGSAVGREQGSTVQPLLALSLRGRRWTAARFVMRYGPVEDLLLDPAVDLEVGYAATAWGSERNRLLFSCRVTDWSRFGTGYLLGDVRGEAGTGSEDFLKLGAVGGWFARHGGRRLTRIVVEGGVSDDRPGDEAFVLGLTRGLRTIDYDGMAGDRLLRWNLEHAKLFPGELLGFTTVALAAFYGGGSAWWRGEDRGLRDARHEMGIGLRFGPTRSALAEVARLDLTWPLDSDEGPTLTAATTGLF